MEFTTKLDLHSQANRLCGRASWTTRHAMKDGILTLSDTVFQRIYIAAQVGWQRL